jgi:hypothetical protein
MSAGIPEDRLDKFSWTEDDDDALIFHEVSTDKSGELPPGEDYNAEEDRKETEEEG